MTRINPFKPFHPVPPGLFAGRAKELIQFEKGLRQTKAGQSMNFLILGERGIGKSSLLMYLRYIANGGIKSLNNDVYNFISVPLKISPKLSLPALIKMIERILSRELKSIESLRGFFSETWKFVQRIKIMESGISQKTEDNDPDLLIENIAYSISETVKRITNPEKGESSKDGIVFLIDEADSANQEIGLGYFFKSVTEWLQLNGCDNVMFAMAGLPEVLSILSDSHESSVRVFDQVKIKELNVDDRKIVIDNGIEESNRVNEEKVSISESAKQMISTFSEGYPHFIQQFAYSAFDYNSDGEISETDVVQSAMMNGGALDAIGAHYYEPAYNRIIKSDEYREVLTIMSESMNNWVKKAEIREAFSGDNARLSNALQALTKRKIILKNPSKMGEYRLQQRGFALWIRIFGNRQK